MLKIGRNTVVKGSAAEESIPFVAAFPAVFCINVLLLSMDNRTVLLLL